MITKEQEKVKAHVIDTLIHKQYFIAACLKMVEYLYQNGRDVEAIELAKRGSMHDHSKLEKDETNLFIKLPAESKTQKPNGNLTPTQKKLLELHWMRNRHHPEYFNDYHEMTDVDIMEMCCDWYARSMQFENDFWEYVLEKPQKRFGFDDIFFQKVIVFCSVLKEPNQQYK